MQEPMPDHILAILIVLIFVAGYCAVMLLATVIGRYRYWRSHRREEEDKDATD